MSKIKVKVKVEVYSLVPGQPTYTTSHIYPLVTEPVHTFQLPGEHLYCWVNRGKQPMLGIEPKTLRFEVQHLGHWAMMVRCWTWNITLQDSVYEYLYMYLLARYILPSIMSGSIFSGTTLTLFSGTFQSSAATCWLFPAFRPRPK